MRLYTAILSVIAALTNPLTVSSEIALPKMKPFDELNNEDGFCPGKEYACTSTFSYQNTTYQICMTDPNTDSISRCNNITKYLFRPMINLVSSVSNGTSNGTFSNVTLENPVIVASDISFSGCYNGGAFILQEGNQSAPEFKDYFIPQFLSVTQGYKDHAQTCNILFIVALGVIGGSVLVLYGTLGHDICKDQDKEMKSQSSRNCCYIFL